MTSDIKKVDPRVKRTRELIINAFITLVKKKSIESITINDITSIATINRATFYAHFPDKYALLDTIISENFIEILHQKYMSGKKVADHYHNNY